MASSQECCGSTSDGLAEQLRQAGSEISPGPTGSGRLRTPANTRPGHVGGTNLVTFIPTLMCRRTWLDTPPPCGFLPAQVSRTTCRSRSKPRLAFHTCLVPVVTPFLASRDIPAVSLPPSLPSPAHPLLSSPTQPHRRPLPPGVFDRPGWPDESRFKILIPCFGTLRGQASLSPFVWPSLSGGAASAFLWVVLFYPSFFRVVLLYSSSMFSPLGVGVGLSSSRGATPSPRRKAIPDPNNGAFPRPAPPPSEWCCRSILCDDCVSQYAVDLFLDPLRSVRDGDE